MAFFFDMDNPAVRDDFSDEDSDDDSDDDDYEERMHLKSSYITGFPTLR